MNRTYYIAKSGNDNWDGTEERPFSTISRAAELAMPGDTVIVGGGEYRECVDPKEGGINDAYRITYIAANNEHPVIKGSERISTWNHLEGDVWEVELPNSFFGSFNPYKEHISGDWVLYPGNDTLHLGDVYLNGKSLYEAKSLEEVKKPSMRTEGYNPPWTKHKESIKDPEDTLYQWYGEVNEDNTVIYANFQGAAPNKELVEINVREYCFYPSRTGRNYITVSGFEMAQAACPWAPPTADQPGLIGTHWSKGWIIENNDIHDAKCSAVSLGKEETTGNNLSTRTHRKPGYVYQMESVCRALQIGWSKETIGSHIVRHNVIHDCGQNGIVGHLGCVFSEISDNEIFNIAVKHEFFGYEIGGIKLHAAIDVQVVHNNIHDCTLGTWLDWEAQGTRVSRNLYYHNDRDIMVEVTHGPYIVDNNIFASEYNFDNIAQGGAYIHNLCCGTMRREAVLNRSTPYHFPHTTQLAGISFVYSGDDRLYQNIFLGGQETYTEQSKDGTYGYDGSPVSMEEYKERIIAEGSGDEELYVSVKQPAYINNNCYLSGARAFDREENHYISNKDPMIKILRENDKTYIEFLAEKEMIEMKSAVINSAKLGMGRAVDALYETPDGKEIIFDEDFIGNKRNQDVTLAGPFAKVSVGMNRVRIW